MYQKSSKWDRRPVWLDRKLLMELKRKNKLYAVWKQGQALQQFNTAAVHICRGQDAKGQSSTRVESDRYCVRQPEGFLKYTSSKRRSKENSRMIVIEDGHLTIKGEELWRHSMFASVFNKTDKLLSAQSLDLEDDFRNNDFPFV